MIAQIQAMCSRQEHHFWGDDLSIVDCSRFNHGHVLGPKQITDVYLLGLAVRNQGRLLTLDGGISAKAVAGASKAHLSYLSR